MAAGHRAPSRARRGARESLIPGHRERGRGSAGLHLLHAGDLSGLVRHDLLGELFRVGVAALRDLLLSSGDSAAVVLIIIVRNISSNCAPVALRSCSI